MAHELDFSTGGAAVFTVGEAPWHKLGTVVADAQTSAEAIRLCRRPRPVHEAEDLAAIAERVGLPVGRLRELLGAAG